jgi:squalene-associated FAD-dependent desaturase
MGGTRRIHIVGAGVAGLAAALQLSLAGEMVALYEAAPFAGGRCRSFFDRDLGHRIDNGNHLVLSGNAAIQDYLFLSNALETMGGPGEPVFPFFDIKADKRWTIRMSKGRLPFWLFDKTRRIPGTSLGDYASSLARLAVASSSARVAGCLDTASPLYRCFWAPLVIGALNTEPELASAGLLSNLLNQSFAAGGQACIPLIPKIGLSETFVQPCLNVLRQNGVEVNYNHRLRGIALDGRHVRELDFNGEVVELPPQDWVIFALPAWVTRTLLPEVTIPNDFRSIVSAHYRVDGLHDPVGFVGIVGGLAEWVFTRDGIVSATVSCAERYGNYPVRDMAWYMWQDVAKLYGLDPDRMPERRIFKERYATFAATPEQNRLRPTAWIGWKNLALAGEWTATGLPSTIEGAVRSGFKAAQVVMRWD